MQTPPVATSVLPMTVPVSVSSMSDPSLGEMQNRLTAIRTGPTAIHVSGSEGQGIVQIGTAKNDENPERWYTPASATLPYLGLDGHPRRIEPILVSVPISLATVVNPKNLDQMR